MKIALLDFHRRKFYRTDETHKIKIALESHPEAEVDTFEMMKPSVPQIPLDEYAGFVLGGADSNYVERYPGYRAAGRTIAGAIEKEKSVLGICAGNQFLGKLHGCELIFMEEPEAGWYEIFLTGEGEADPLFKNISGRFISYQSHIKYVAPGDSVPITLLASNENCRQAFRYRKNVYGIQFHPEETRESGEELLRMYDRRPPTGRHRQGTPDMLEGHRIFQNFVDIVASNSHV